MIKVKRALISVSDKTGILELARQLNKFDVEIISTGGTAKLLKKNNIAVVEVADYTGFPEILDGRVKTLHPKIHAGLLACRRNQRHLKALKKRGINLIDMLVVNLYPFEEGVSKRGKTENLVELIDIGGPAMLRAAAKNYQSVICLSAPSQYQMILEELERNAGSIREKTAKNLAAEVFCLTSYYDGVIHRYLNKDIAEFPQELNFGFTKIQRLRYGENSHQKAALYKLKAQSSKLKGIVDARQIQGKDLSFNNILDLNSACELLKEFKEPTAVILKHNNPCGVAQAQRIGLAFLNAWRSDSLSAFGGIVGLNRGIDLNTAKIILGAGFLECIIAPGFTQGAIETFARKKNLRIIKLSCMDKSNKGYDFKRVEGGILLQTKDIETLNEKTLQVMTKKKPTEVELRTLKFAWKVAKHIRSNAIVLAKNRRTVGIGAGQPSRIDALIIAKRKGGSFVRNSCLASDGFLPKPDTVIEAHKSGVRAIIQPGGSIADQEIINLCDKFKIAMVMTGIRHFKH